MDIIILVYIIGQIRYNRCQHVLICPLPHMRDLMDPREIVRKLVFLNPTYIHDFNFTVGFPDNLGSDIERKGQIVWLGSITPYAKTIRYEDWEEYNEHTGNLERYGIFKSMGFKLVIGIHNDALRAVVKPNVNIQGETDEIFKDFDFDNPVLPKRYNDIYEVIFQEKWLDPTFIKHVEYRKTKEKKTRLINKEKL